jgi:hypothetical protein
VRCAWPARVPVGERDLHRGVGGFRAGVAEEHVVEVGRRQRRDPAGQLEGARMAELEGRREVELGACFWIASTIGPRLWPALVHHSPAAPSRTGPALRRVVVHVLGARDQPRPALEGAVGGERHEERLRVVRDRRGGVVLRCVLSWAILVRSLLSGMRAETPALIILSRIMTKEGVAVPTPLSLMPANCPNNGGQSNKLKARLPRGSPTAGPPRSPRPAHDRGDPRGLRALRLRAGGDARRSNTPTRSASSCPTRTGRTRACSRSKDDDEQCCQPALRP